MKKFTINPDITRAETLSSDFYTDKDLFELSKEKIFAQSWQLVSTVDQISNQKPVNFLPDFINEPILLTKTKNDEVNCISNVCTHRGKILVEESCNGSGIRCGYHGRRFDLSGKFLSMPEFEEAKNFPTEKDDLAKIPCKIWEDFVFVSLDPFAPLDDLLGEIKQITHDFDFAGLKLVSTKDYEINAHWALYCENYLEGFHIPFVHRSLNEELDYESYETELFRYSSLQTGFDENGKLAARYFFIFPNLMFNFYDWGISLNIVKPVREDFTKVIYWTFVNDESKRDIGAGADLETVEFEDQAVVESAQKGIESRFYDRGRYSPTQERGTHHFHRLIAEFFD